MSRIWPLVLVLAGLGPLSVQSAQGREVSTVDAQFEFDLAPQPLAEALTKVALITGVAVLNDSSIVEGKRSPRVRGRMTAQQALLLLLHGTDLKARVTASGSIVVTPGRKPDIMLDRLDAVSRPGLGRTMVDPAWIAYSDLVQRRIRDAIRKDQPSAQGHHQISVRLWISPEGTIIRCQVVRGSGDPAWDQRNLAIFQRMDVGERPPENLRQPIALQFGVR